MLSAGEWLAKFDGIPGDTRAAQLPYIQYLFERTGLNAIGVTADEHVGVDGVVIVQANSADDLGVIQKDLQLVPGFNSVEPWDDEAGAGTRHIFVPQSPFSEQDGAPSETSSFSAVSGSDPLKPPATTSGPSTVQAANGFNGINSTQTAQLSPPDTNGAVGPSSFIETVNISLAIYDKTTGLTKPGGGITSFGTFFSPLGGELNFSDPVVIYNDITQRFAVSVLDFSLDVSGNATAMREDFAISKTNNPTLSPSDWNFFRYNTNDGIGAPVDFSDYPKVGYNADGYVISFDMFPNSFDHVSVLGIGNDGTSTGMRLMPGGFSNFTLAPASMHGAAPGAPMWFLGDGHGGGGGNTINVVRLDNPFSAAAVISTSFSETVASFGNAPNPRQPSGSLGTSTSLGTRFYFSGLRSVGGVTHLVSAHAVGNGTGVESRWYDFNVTTGTPTLIQQGTVNPNTSTTDTYFPDIDIAPDGSIGMNYSESGTSEYMSMYVTGRNPTDPTSTMQTPVLAKSNPVALNAFNRAGDYSLTTIDPTDGTFWAANEYASSFASPNWATWIQHFTLGGLAVVSSTPSSGAVVASPPANFVIGFSDPIDPATLQSTDLQVNSISASGVTLSADNRTATFTYTVNPVTSQGLQTMTMAAGAVTKLGSPATVLAAFGSSFRYDALLLQVAATNPPANAAFSLPGPFTYDVTFNEPINPASITTSSLVLSGIPGAAVVGVTVLPGNTTARFTLSIGTEGVLNASISVGAVTDQYGNLGLAFATTEYVDISVSAPIPVPLSAEAPLGSLIYDPTATGFITHLGDTDTFTLSVDPGQTISVLVTPTSAGLKPSVQLLSPTNAVIGTATATAAGLMALIQATPTTGTVTGTYKIIIAGASGTTGSYTVQLTLNAALELEGRLAGFSDDTPATAQGISGSLIGLSASDSNVKRAAVLGQTDVSSGYTASAASFNFENISTTGTVISFSNLDDGATQIPIGFGFTMFATIYSNLYVSTNGLITFGSANTTFTNADLTSSPSQAAIAPFWDDLNDTGEAGSNIVYQLLGSGPTTHLVIQWNNVSYFDDTIRLGGLTFEAVLNIDGSIRFNYQSLATGYNGGTHDLGTSAAAGIKGAGTQGSNWLLLMNNNGPTALVNSGKSVVIAPLTPTPDYYSVTVAASEMDTFAVTSLSGGSLNLELLDNSGSLIETGIAGATNLTKVVSNFNFITPGTYYARVTGAQNVSYSLIATRNTAVDTESNDSFATAQSLDGTRGALGYVKGGFSTTTDFESGQAGYVINNNIRGTGSGAGLWHLSTIRGAQAGHSASNSFYYGNENTGTYNTGAANAGSITSPVIALPNSGQVNLSFNYVLQAEISKIFDTANVQVSTDGFAMFTTVGSRNSNLPNSATWTSFTASLAAFAGQNIQIRFVFDTIDSVANNFEGWYVDDIQLTSASGGFDQDWYSITTTGTENRFILATSTPAGGTGEFVNTLPPQIELYNPSGIMVASGVIGPDGRNESIQYIASIPGVYRVRVLSQNSNFGGEYFLSSLFGASAVTNRQLFYANSVFDGYTHNPATAHDESIALDKVALLPNQGESTFTNISSYGAGINGIMVDISAGANHAAMKANAASDFTFRVSGRFASNATNTWTTLSGANLPSVNVRLGDPAAGTDRIELVWPNGTIVGTWLEVTVKANADSGLTADDVFYFGSSPGDTGFGNDPEASFVDATDELLVSNHQESDLSLKYAYDVAKSNIYDFNRDGQVDATDQIFVRNFADSDSELDMIDSSANGPVAVFVGTSATRDANTSVASALSNKSNSFVWPQSVPTLLDNILGDESVDSITSAKYLSDLVWESTSPSQANLSEVDHWDLSGLSEELLDSLLIGLGLG